VSSPDKGDLYWDAGEIMVPQVYSWTCSACSLDWVLKATDLDNGSGDVYFDRVKVTEKIGYPDHINPAYGLMDGSGAQLRRVLEEYGQGTGQAWLGFDAVYDLAQTTTGMMSGGNWYHWVGIRGVSGPNLLVANSAPGYKGIWDVLSRSDFNRLGGFSVVWLEA
jgi:hypothetical protein